MMYEKPKRIQCLLQISLIYFWMNFLRDTDAVYSVYLVFGIVGLIAVFCNYNKGTVQFINKRQKIGFLILAVLFSASVIFSNYRIVYILRERFNGLATSSVIDLFIIGEFIIVVIGSAVLIRNYLIFLLFNFKSPQKISYGEARKTNPSWMLTVFCIILIYSSVLFLFGYPGTLTMDSVSQLNQIATGEYSNHYPFYHTILIKVCVDLGLLLFGDINKAIAFYSVIQIIIVAFCISFMISTISQIGTPKIIRLSWLIWFLLLPIHVVFSFTMWKDVLFGYFVAIFAACIYRIVKGIGGAFFNNVLLFLSSLIFCLFRSNGLFAFLISFMAFLIIYKMKYKKAVLIMLFSACIAIGLKYPVLDMLEVPQPRTAEGLSIPEQQIARVIVDGKQLTENETMLISRVIDIDKVPELYLDYLSDPIKAAIDDQYLSTHKREFFDIWISIGRRYPKEYLKAWIDQTRGYWNAGYDVAPYTYGVFANNLGIKGIMKNRIYLYYMQLFRLPALMPLLSIGLYFWIICVLLTYNYLKKNKDVYYLIIPILAIWVSLLIASPAFSEVRYIYALFTCFPLIVTASFIDYSC